MISLLKRLFVSSGNAEVPPCPESAATPATGSAAAVGQPPVQVEGEGVEGFVLYVVRALVDNSDAVRVTAAETDRATVITVACEKRDIGKIIGKSGRTIAAIRALANGAGGRVGKRINVEVQD
jgi:predicted RNA-binding protein YlqC (UPF0109 family)